MKSKKTIYWGSFMAYLIGCFFLLYMVMTNVSEFGENMLKYTDIASAEHGAMEAWNWIPFLGDWEENVAEAEVFHGRAMRNYAEINMYALFYVAASIVFIILSVLLFRKTKEIWKYLSLSMLIVSIICLVIGVSAPTMDVDVFVEDFKLSGIEYFSTFEGNMHVVYQLKSIAGLVAMLFGLGDYVLGFAILLFSIILPAIKLVLSVLQLFSSKVAKNRVGNFITNYLGKWSMADVFVVSILLAVLAVAQMGQPGVSVETHALIGIYYFFGYCILSLLTTYFIKNHVKLRDKMEESVE